MSKDIGITVTPSTTQDVKILVMADNGLDELKNQMVYFDVESNNKETSRAIGFVNEITTLNKLGTDLTIHSAAAYSRAIDETARQADVRNVDINVASVFTLNSDGDWLGNKPLPTSPSTGTRVHLADKESINELFSRFDKEDLSYLGNIRGAASIPAPLLLPYFGGARGASSIGFVGRTGSGKTDFATKFICSMMKYPDHFTLVVDPQGQWGNENGFTISPQKMAKALGRKVYNLRVAENIQLPLDDENLINMLTQIDLWGKMGRMAKENRDLLSMEVAELIAGMAWQKINGCTKEENYKDLLAEVLSYIASSDAIIARIYASSDKQDSFKNSLYSLVNPAKSAILSKITVNGRAIAGDLRANKMPSLEEDVYEYVVNDMISKNAIVANPNFDEKLGDSFSNNEYLVSDAEMDAVNKRWEGILAKFVPLLNLFQSHNLAGESREPLSGDFGFLEKVLKVRSPHDEPAPYVILDMSPDTSNNAKSEFLGGKDVMLNMRKLLDNDSIKATILMMVFTSLKEASETAFSMGGNLNTNVVFDEAWRYAPERSDNEIILKLSKMLEGYALDTRKFGIGWTYILQSPTDLRQGIWKQLKFVFAGYGLVGADLGRMSDLMDDPIGQLKTYKQFVAPDLTGEYPFMMVGSLSPLITAQIPLFVNSYNSVDAFLDDNRVWLDGNTSRAGLPPITSSALKPGKLTKKDFKNAKSYTVGGISPEGSEKVVSNFKKPEATRIVAEDPFATPMENFPKPEDAPF